MARAVIYGLSGPALTPAEAAFFRDADPWGFILFARNIEAPAQVHRLTGELRAAVGWQAPVLIDQEGGRVQRMGPPHWRQWPPARDAVEAEPDEMAVLAALRARYGAIAADLLAVGVDVDCVPVLDVPQPNAHPIIGDRALGATGMEVALRGREAMAALIEAGVLPVIKHLPGHGRALADSHEALPRVTATLEELRRSDFLPFRALADAPLGMTAHVVYEAIDPDACATLSPACIRLIREELRFDGALMTDDLSMGALSGPMDARAGAALAAGCDLILHCNGEMQEMVPIASAVPALEGQAAARCARALALRDGAAAGGGAAGPGAVHPSFTRGVLHG